MPEKYKSESINNVIKNINNDIYVLPTIQRQFVWKESQITDLFDSIMRGFPIGSFLFWKADKKTMPSYRKFVRDFDVKEKNLETIESNEDPITYVLDGQQRISALYIGLEGSFTPKRGKREKRLHLDLLYEPTENDETKYQFKFIEQLEGGKENYRIVKDKDGKIKNCWFLLSSLLRNSRDGFIKDLAKLKEREIDPKKIEDLRAIIYENEPINYFLITDEELESVLKIFTRTNTGGTQLSNADLLLSTTATYWSNENVVKEIYGFAEKLNTMETKNRVIKFDFNKDFVLKSCLILSDLKNITFKAASRQSSIKEIEAKWQNIKRALIRAVDLIARYGYDKSTLAANNAVIPIAYYIISSKLSGSKLPKDDENKIIKWLRRSILKRIFRGATDNTLKKIRDIIKKSKNNGFPYDKIHAKISLKIEDGDIADWLENVKYDTPSCFSLLSYLYNNKKIPGEELVKDHIFPKNRFNDKELKKFGVDENKINPFIEHKDDITNLQLLPKSVNESKGDQLPKEWIKEHFSKEDRVEHCIPINDKLLCFRKFDEFRAKRKKEMLEKIKENVKKDNSS